MIQLATLCYIEKDGKTLMLERGKKIGDIHRGKFNGLGGKLEVGENPEQCVVREVFEESGLHIDKPDLVGLLTFPKFTKNQDWRVYVYKASKFSGTITESAEGELSWQPTNKLHSLPLWEGDRYFLRWIEQRKFFVASFYYEEKILQKFQVQFRDNPTMHFA